MVPQYSTKTKFPDYFWKFLSIENVKFWFQLKPKKNVKVFEFIQQVPHKIPLLEGSNTQRQYPKKPLMVSHGIKKSLIFGFR